MSKPRGTDSYLSNRELTMEEQQNQPYPSSKFYPYPEPKNTFRLNPLVLSSLKNIDIDDLQDILGKGIQDKHIYEKAHKMELNKLFNENLEIKDIKDCIHQANLNKFRAQQINENHVRRLQNLMKDTEADEEVLRAYEREKKLAEEEEAKKQQDRFKVKYLIQQQMREKEELQKQEAQKEYLRDKQEVDDIINRIKEEDLAALKEDQRKKAIARSYMENAYAEKAARKQQEKENERLRKEQERKYHEDVAKREAEHNSKKAAVQFEKDKIFDKLCQEKAQQQAEADYWENVRNELHSEQENRKARLQELEEKEKLQRQKEEMLASAIAQMKEKEQRKKDAEAEEAKFKQHLMEIYAQDEKLEQYNKQKRMQKMLDLKAEAEKQWQMKKAQYEAQREKEIAELEKEKRYQESLRYLIEQEKARLIKENEELLKKYYPLGYSKVVKTLRPEDMQKPPQSSKSSKHEVIYNNIFGNTNPNKPSAYPKYGKVENFVYDIDVQDVNHNINMENYPMYNATLNNNYDSYPSQEEYKNMMEKTGQKGYKYAGGNVESNPGCVPITGFMKQGQRLQALQNSVKQPQSAIPDKYKMNASSSYLPQNYHQTAMSNTVNSNAASNAENLYNTVQSNNSGYYQTMNRNREAEFA